MARKTALPKLPFTVNEAEKKIIIPYEVISNLGEHKDNVEFLKSIGYTVDCIFPKEKVKTKRKSFTYDSAKTYIEKTDIEKLDEFNKIGNDKLVKIGKTAKKTDKFKPESYSAKWREQEKWFKDTYGEDVYSSLLK